MRRNLDNSDFEIDGEHICFSDMTEEQQDSILNRMDNESVKKMCKHLSKVLNIIGDMFDLVYEEEKENE